MEFKASIETSKSLKESEFFNDKLNEFVISSDSDESDDSDDNGILFVLSSKEYYKLKSKILKQKIKIVNEQKKYYEERSKLLDDEIKNSNKHIETLLTVTNLSKRLLMMTKTNESLREEIVRLRTENLDILESYKKLMKD